MRFCQLCRHKGYEGKEICAYDSQYLSQDVNIDPPVGTQIDKYSLTDVVSMGSTGIVYKAKELSGGKIVAVKILHADLYSIPNILYRLKREIKSAIKLNSINIAQILDCGEFNGRFYIVREWLTGYPVSVELVKGFLPLDRSLQIAYQICNGLSAAHRMGIIHRDLKPNHIFLADIGGGNIQVKLIDFGIATQIQSLIKSGKEIIGTPAYVSPEQIQGKLISLRADLYSLGCLIFYLVTGYEPYRGGSENEILENHLNSPLPSLKDLHLEAPSGLDQLVQKLMSKQASARPLSTTIVQRELEKITDNVKNNFSLSPQILEEVQRTELQFGSKEDISSSKTIMSPSISQADQQEISMAKTMMYGVSVPPMADLPPQSNINPQQGQRISTPPPVAQSPSKFGIPKTTEPKAKSPEAKKTILGMPAISSPFAPKKVPTNPPSQPQPQQPPVQPPAPFTQSQAEEFGLEDDKESTTRDQLGDLPSGYEITPPQPSSIPMSGINIPEDLEPVEETIKNEPSQQQAYEMNQQFTPQMPPQPQPMEQNFQQNYQQYQQPQQQYQQEYQQQQYSQQNYQQQQNYQMQQQGYAQQGYQMQDLTPKKKKGKGCMIAIIILIIIFILGIVGSVGVFFYLKNKAADVSQNFQNQLKNIPTMPVQPVQPLPPQGQQPNPPGNQ